MFFPEEMNFRYFFFDTYPGYFLQVLPIALAAAIVYWRRHKDTAISKCQLRWTTVFVCYLTGLLCLVLAFQPIRDLWFILLYWDFSINTRLFVLEFDFEPHLLDFLNTENIFNLLMFLPFGVLYPLSRRKDGWGKTLLAGLILVVGIEVLQPIFGRAFDINDVVLDTLGTSLSATLYFLCRWILRKMKRKAPTEAAHG